MLCRPRIAGVACIGHLDRFGYQHVFMDCLSSAAEMCERFYLIQHVYNNSGVQELTARHRNIVHWIGAATLMPMANGDFVFDHRVLIRNGLLGIELARSDGLDCVVMCSLNWYVPETAQLAIRRECADMLKCDDGFRWLYRKDQFGAQMFHASVRLPLILNLSHHIAALAHDTMSVDGIRCDMERGDFAARDAEAMVDVGLELTVGDLRDKLDDARCYHDILPKRNPVFDWGYWHKYYLAKFRQKHKSDEPLCAIGRAIASRSRPDFVSNILLDEL